MSDEEGETPAGPWSHDGYPLTWPRCALCKLFRRPLKHLWGTGWICEECA